jgi:hypothetical protein
MAINIFSVANDKSNEGTSDDVVGRFRSGFQSPSGRPVGLSEFRLTSGSREVAETIRNQFGGDEVTTWETKTGETFQVFTTTGAVDVIIEPNSVKATLNLWSNKGSKIVETDGAYLYDLETGKLTDTPWSGANRPLSEIKEDARNGIGPSPSLQVYFRLKDLPEIGKIKYFSSSWTAIQSFNAAEDALKVAGQPLLATLRLDPVEFERQGETISFVRPQIDIIGDAADAEDAPF